MELNHVSVIGCTYNCIETDYPIAEVLESYWNHCHEIVVVDANSDDGTLEVLQQCQRKSPIPFIIDAHFPYWDGKDLEWLVASRQRGFDLAASKWVWMIDMDEFLSMPISSLSGNSMRVKIRHCEINPRLYTNEYESHIRVVVKEKCIKVEDHYFRAENSEKAEECGAVVLHYSALRRKKGLIKKVNRIFSDWHKRDDSDVIFKHWWGSRERRNKDAQLYSGPIPDSAKRWLLERGWGEEDLKC